MQLVEDSNGNVKIVSSNAGKDFAAEEISAQVLRKLCDDASKFLNDKVRIATANRPKLLFHISKRCPRFQKYSFTSAKLICQGIVDMPRKVLRECVQGCEHTKSFQSFCKARGIVEHAYM